MNNYFKLFAFIFFSQILSAEEAFYFCEDDLTKERRYKTYKVRILNLSRAVPFYEERYEHYKIKGKWGGYKFMISRQDYNKFIDNQCNENETMRPYGGFFHDYEYDFHIDD